MTRRKALQVLIAEASASVAGSGCGIRTTLTEERRQRVAQAVARLYRDAYDFDPDGSVYHNLGLPIPEGAGE